MKITLRQIINKNCKFVLESEEYLLRKTEQAGVKGNGINAEGEPVFMDDDGNEILIEDLLKSATLQDLYDKYDKLDKEVVKFLWDKFYSIYKFIDAQTYMEQDAKKMKMLEADAKFLEELADDWGYDF